MLIALLINVAVAGETGGRKVTKQFLDDISKMDANYMKKVTRDAKTGIYYDFNDLKHTESLVKRINEKKAKAEGVPAIEIAKPESKTEPVKNNFGPSSKKNNVNNSAKPTKSTDPQLAEYEKRLELEKARMVKLKGEELKICRENITYLEKEINNIKQKNSNLK